MDTRFCSINSFIRCFLGVILLVCNLSSARALPQVPGSYLLTYISDIDDSSQQYGLYLPTTFTPNATYPIVFIGHGFGGRASKNFHATAKTFANARGLLLVQLDGRGNTFYDGVGEKDMYDVLEILKANYHIDTTRLYFEGGSMGATGAYRQGTRHPDLLAAVGGADGWADYRYWYRHWYAPTSNPSYVEPCRVPNLEMASCLDVAEGAKWQNYFMVVDTNDETVWPQNTYNFDARLSFLDALTPEADYVHTVQKNIGGGHTAGYSTYLQAMYTFFLTKVNNPAPSRVAFKTKRLKYGTIYWVSIDRMLHTDSEWAVIDAVVDGNTVNVTTQNIIQYSLKLDDRLLGSASTVTVLTNGMPSYSGPVKPITLYAHLSTNEAITGWSTTNTYPTGLYKTAAVEGPIGDAFTSKFRVVYGTIPSANNTSQADASTFCQNWYSWMLHATINAKSDTQAILDNDMASCNLILFGTADSNKIIQSLQPYLPILVTEHTITVGNKQYAGTNYGVFFIYPNPLNPDRYVVICSKTIPGSQPKDLEALPWYWPDFVVFDTDRAPASCVQSSLYYLPTTFVQCGYFDRDWQFKSPLASVNLDRSATSRTAVGTPVHLSATITGGDIPEYRFRVGTYRTNGTVNWTVIQDWNGSSACTWTPVQTGTFLFGVDAREQGVTRRKDLLDGLQVRLAVTDVALQVSPANSAGRGSAITMIAKPTGGGSLEYQFLYRSSDVEAWTVLRGWSTEPSYSNWRPTDGNYYLMVQARERGTWSPILSSKPLYYVIKDHLRTICLSATPLGYGFNGQFTTLIATSGGGQSIEYQFVEQDPLTRRWMVRQNWNSRDNYISWHSSGTYVFAVYARERANPSSLIKSESLIYRVSISGGAGGLRPRPGTLFWW